MKVFIVGGTGLLGSAGAAELIRRGHSVRSIALPPIPKGASLPSEMELILGNMNEMSDGEIKRLIEGCEGLSSPHGLTSAWSSLHRFTKPTISIILHLLRGC
ncbi:MAG: hypothetical protein FGF50_05705 [Candidatus Brockarchaeota archaeon]|nr:hypothetical protein [Candidatus Brockarchaeota archaeon]